MNLVTIELRHRATVDAMQFFRELDNDLNASQRVTPRTTKWWWTCDDCPAADNCEFAFDLYNTNYDCLAEK